VFFIRIVLKSAEPIMTAVVAPVSIEQSRPVPRSSKAAWRVQHRRAARGQIVVGVSIRERPAEVEDRALPDHWEGCSARSSRSGELASMPGAGRPESARAQEDRQLTSVVRAAFEAGRRYYGSPRVYRELKAQADCAESARTEFPAAGAEPELGERHDRTRHRRRQVVPGRSARPVLPLRRRLGGERGERSASGDQGARHGAAACVGCCTTRTRQPVPERRLAARPGGTRHYLQHEQVRQVLRQRCRSPETPKERGRFP
jgi:hypothetical protein